MAIEIKTTTIENTLHPHDPTNSSTDLDLSNPQKIMVYPSAQVEE